MTLTAHAEAKRREQAQLDAQRIKAEIARLREADEERRAETELQKLTDERIGEIDSFLAGKEEEILEV